MWIPSSFDRCSLRKRNLVTLILVCLAIIAVSMVVPVLGSPGGVGNRNLQANGCTAHNIAGTDAVSMSASKLNPMPGEQITVTVTVTGSQGSGAKMGVSLLAALSGSTGTMPSDKGWTIISDPSGTKYNYNEKSYSGSGSFTWTLKAPSAAGTYKLYARAYMGPSFYYKDATQGVTFSVSNLTVTSPTVQVTAPASGATVRGNFLVTAAATSDSAATIATVRLSIDGVLIGTLTTVPFSWSVNSAGFLNGLHTVNVTVADNGNRMGYAQQTITISNVVLPANGTKGPSIIFSTPVNGSAVSGMVAVNLSVSSSVRVTNVTLGLDGALISTLSAPPYSWKANSSGLLPGTHAFQAYAFDSAGGYSTAQATILVQPSPVTIDIILSPVNSGVVELLPTIKSNETVSYVLFTVDGTLLSRVTSAPYSYSFDTTTISNGPHTLNITVVTTSGTKWSEEFSIEILNNGIASDIGSGFAFTNIDLLVTLSLITIMVLAIISKVGGKRKGPDIEHPIIRIEKPR
jgi:hypothetical protein